MSRLFRKFAAVLALGLLAACSGDDVTQPPPGPPPPPPPPGPAPVASVTLGAMPTLVIGGTAQLTAVVKDAQGNTLDGRTITWASSAPEFVSINATGTVTAIAVGTTTISATSEGKAAQAQLTVSPVPVAAVAVTPATFDLGVGRQRALAAAATDQAGAPLPGRPAAWTSVDPSVATVDAEGIVIGVAPGSTKILATIEGKVGEATVTVAVIPVASVAITPGTASVRIGRTVGLAAMARDAAGIDLPGRPVVWSSADPAIATVAPGTGVVTGVAPGKVAITASIEGKQSSAEVTVSLAPVASVALTPGDVTLALAATKAYAATLKDEDGQVLTGRTVTWSSSNPAAATVDQTGLVTAVDGGNAVITATSEGKSASATVTVHLPVASIAMGAVLDTLEAWSSVPLVATAKDAKGRNLTGRTITWTVSNRTIAVDTTNSSGQPILLGLDRGTVTVTATSEGVSASITRVVIIKYRSIAAGTMHVCDLASGGIVWCWGLNGNEARLGDDVLGADAYRSTPYAAQGGHRFTKIVTYGRHGCGLKNDGHAWCWGYNGWGMLGGGSNASISVTPLPVSGNLVFTSISAGSDHACGVAVGGQAWCWGQNDWGQLGIGNTAASSTPKAVAGGIQFSSIAAGPAFTCGVAFDGAVWCWGANSIGQLGDGGPISYGNVYKNTPQKVVGGLSFISVTLGSQFACGRVIGGASYCWGRNGGRFGDGPTGNDSSSPKATAGGLTFKVLSAGYGHVCGVAQDDGVYCWGGNGNGQLGYVAVNGSTTPQRAAGGMLAADVAAAGIATGSGAHTCAISRDRLTTYCWGRNDYGQLGNGTTTAGAIANPAAVIVSGQKPLPAN